MTLTGRLFHRAGAATENARLASSVRVLGTIRRGWKVWLKEAPQAS